MLIVKRYELLSDRAQPKRKLVLYLFKKKTKNKYGSVEHPVIREGYVI